MRSLIIIIITLICTACQPTSFHVPDQTNPPHFVASDTELFNLYHDQNLKRLTQLHLADTWLLEQNIKAIFLTPAEKHILENRIRILESMLRQLKKQQLNSKK